VTAPEQAALEAEPRDQAACNALNAQDSLRVLMMPSREIAHVDAQRGRVHPHANRPAKEGLEGVDACRWRTGRRIRRGFGTSRRQHERKAYINSLGSKRGENDWRE
jgi:hypothetical protein